MNNLRAHPTQQLVVYNRDKKKPNHTPLGRCLNTLSRIIQIVGRFVKLFSTFRRLCWTEWITVRKSCENEREFSDECDKQDGNERTNNVSEIIIGGYLTSGGQP